MSVPEDKETIVDEPAAEATPAAPSQKLGVGIALLFVLATLATTLAFLSIWAERQIFSTDQWTETSTELLEQPEVRSQLANYLVDQLFENVDVQGQLEQNLPTDLKGLAGPATGGLRQLALRGANTALEQPAVQTAWKNANRVAHEKLIEILEGGNEKISTEGGVVTVNTKLILKDVADQVGLPTSLVDKLPASAGSLEVLHSDELETAQNGYSVLKGVAWVSAILAVLLFALAIYLAQGRRRRAVLWLGVSLSIVGLLVLLIHSVARQPVIDSLATTAAVEPAIDEIYAVSTTLIKQMAMSVFVTGLLVIVAWWLAGPYRYAVEFRRFLAPYLREYLPASIGAAIILFLLVVWWAPTHGFQTATGLFLNALLAIAGFTALVMMTRREFPDAQPIDFSTVDDWFRERWQGMSGYVREHTQRDEPTTVVSAPAEDEKLAALERLQKLRADGTLSDEEFAAEKKRLLDS